MSEELAENNDTGGEFAGLPEAAPEQDTQPAAAPAPDAPQEPRRQGYVDLSSLPDGLRNPIEGRFAEMSRLIKKSESKREQEVRQWQELAKQQSEQLEKLTQFSTQVATQMEDKSFAESEATLRAQSRAAFEAGDTDKYLELQEKLSELKVEKKLAERERKHEQEKPQKPAAKPGAVQPSYEDAGLFFSDDDMPTLDQWQRETDDAGNLVRPWAINNSQDPRRPDPKFKRGLFETTDVLSDERYANWSIEQKLAEVDKRMGTQRQAQRQTVMGGGLTGNRKIGKLTLSPEQQKMALRLKAGGSKAKTDTDHLKAYQEQLQKIQQQKGAR